MEAATASLQVRVRSVIYEAEDILRFELIDPQRHKLPAFSAGSHIDVHIAPGLVRQYSLCNDPAGAGSYHIAVLNEPAGRGGSKALHEQIRPGDLLTISEPRNFFPLTADAATHLLLAGGIGITPMMAMVAALEAGGSRWHLHYCTRSPQKTAFLDRLQPLISAGKVTLHHDKGQPGQGLDIAATLKQFEADTHLYYCGPAGFMAAVAAAAAHWPQHNLHCEYFSAPLAETSAQRVNSTFQVKIGGNGELLTIPPQKSIVEVLREHGYYVDTSCEEGYCGTCLTPYLEGEPEHRDTVLDDGDRARYVLICCARSKSPVLVLDL